jgi:hypothetical protein
MKHEYVSESVDKYDIARHVARDEQLRIMNKLLLEVDGPGLDIAGVWHLDCPGVTLKYCTDKIHENQKIVGNIHRQHEAEDWSLGQV